MNEITLAVSERVINQAAAAVEKSFQWSSSGETGHSGNVVRVGYDVAVHAEKGVINLIGPRPRPFYSGGIVNISGLSIIWDTLDCYLDLSVPQVCLGGFCIIPDFWGGCILSAPRVCFFGGTIRVGLNLGGGLIASRVSLAFSPDVKQATGEWDVLAHVVYSNVDLIDWGQTMDNVVHAFVQSVVNQLLGFLPGWARDIIDSVVGGLFDWIAGLIGLGSDVVDWLEQLLGVSVGLFNLALTAIADHFEDKLVLLSLNNPYTIMDSVPPAGQLPTLPAVGVAINGLSANIQDAELDATVSL
jgi:hypothetical protein